MLALKHPHYGHRRITGLLEALGLEGEPKLVLQICVSRDPRSRSGNARSRACGSRTGTRCA